MNSRSHVDRPSLNFALHRSRFKYTLACHSTAIPSVILASHRSLNRIFFYGVCIIKDEVNFIRKIYYGFRDVLLSKTHMHEGFRITCMFLIDW